MVKKRDIIKELRAFRKSLEIDIDRMLLFGSHARGDSGKYSDVDLIIVSRMFEGQKQYKRAVPFYRKWGMDLAVDFLCFTPEEFEEAKENVSVVREAVREGVAI